MSQDSVPAGSYDDPFLSSVCICVRLGVWVCGRAWACEVLLQTKEPSPGRWGIAVQSTSGFSWITSYPMIIQALNMRSGQTSEV